MMNYIRTHDFQSFSRELERSESIKDTDMVSWLAESINQGLDKFVELLLGKGVNPNELSSGNLWNPIHLAVEHGYMAILDMLIKAGADIESPDSSGFTPLHHAVDMEADGAYQMDEKPIPKFSKCLLDAGANPLAQDSSGVSVIELAQQYEYRAFLDLVQKPS